MGEAAVAAGSPRLVALGWLTVETLLGPHTAKYWIRRDRTGTQWEVFEQMPGQRRTKLETFDSSTLLEFLAGYEFAPPIEWWLEIGFRDEQELTYYEALMSSRDAGR